MNIQLPPTLPSSFWETSILISIDNNKSRGSAFFYVYNGKQFLVTARHVLFDDDTLYGNMLKIFCPAIGTSVNYNLERSTIINVDLRINKPIKSNRFDICILHVGDVSDDTHKGIYNIRYLSSIEFETDSSKGPPVVDKSGVMYIDQVQRSNEVFLLGYPTSLGLKESPQFDISIPLLRKGIVAGFDTKQNAIILDCAVYHGNSGAPIFQRSGPVTNQYAIIGVVSQFIPYVQEWYNGRDKLKNIEYQNSGYSIITSMDAVDELIKANYK